MAESQLWIAHESQTAIDYDVRASSRPCSFFGPTHELHWSRHGGRRDQCLVPKRHRADAQFSVRLNPTSQSHPIAWG